MVGLGGELERGTQGQVGGGDPTELNTYLLDKIICVHPTLHFPLL